MAQATARGIRRFFTKRGTEAYDMFDWVKRDAEIGNPMTGEVVFQQKQVEFPDSWSLNAVNIVSQKYFSGTPGEASREKSVKQLIGRVADTIARHGEKEGYFVDKEESETFTAELKYILADQRASFNSPVWFNIGVEDRVQQASACFILAVDDTMPSILNWYTEEGMIFKGGSGAGTNLSGLRSSAEQLARSGGKASGPVSFMRGADASAGTIKSGGKTRRAAKMVILNVDHPDVEEFIWCKAIEERKQRVLEAAGFDMDVDGKDSFSIQYQNANNSVRISDDFMKAVEADADWELKAVTDGRTVKTMPARKLWRQIAEAAWECADPGLQFDTTINNWHTAPNEGRINGSNPCSEYMHLDNSACNLASINLLKYLNTDDTFDIDAFRHTTEVLFTAQEILVGYSSYPTEKITKNAKAYRELGIGYANLGALLMAKGLPYDSEEGRAIAATITAMLTGHAYSTSAQMARRVGPYSGFNKDKEAMIGVLKMHRDAVRDIDPALVPEDMLSAAAEMWDDAVEQSQVHGVRNSQASVLAPTGTISFMMDCDTTGIEPDLGLVKFKKLVGGGTMSIVNQTVPRALKALGYSPTQAEDIVKYIDDNSSIVDAPHLKDEHMPVFATSMGDNTIQYMGHIRMMGATQPFISGAISKTVNLPETATVEDIEDLHLESWKLGIKAIAIYRDGSKVAQPLATKEGEKDEADGDSAEKEEVKVEVGSSEAFRVAGPVRRELKNQRKARTYEFYVSDTKGFATVGEFEDGTPGEMFIQVAKQGSTLAGIMNSFGISLSYGLQYGVPLKAFVKALTNMTFAPSGITDDPEIRTASSLTDYIMRRLALDYLSFEDRLELGLATFDDEPAGQTSLIDDKDIESVPEDKISEKEVAASVPEPIFTTTATTDSILDEHIDSLIKEQASAAKTSDEAIESTQSAAKVEDKPVNKPKPASHVDSAPLCSACGNQTIRAGACYVCTACGSSTGCG